MFRLKSYIKFIFLAGVILFSLGTGTAKAANLGDVVNFNVDKNFDASTRTQIPSTLIKISPRLYFYVEKTWWDSQTLEKQSQTLIFLDNLSLEFNNNIYPTLTSTFGYEWNPGIDKDVKISILFESMNSAEGGYFREADEYEKLLMPTSNEREMIYLSLANIDNSNIKTVLAHEFMHLITFNQKNKIFGVEDDTWLNEARADYVSTILGYDNNYSDSNLRARVSDFVESPSDSITDWQDTKYDYASVSLFMHYLVDHYGADILSNSLKSKSIGIASIDEALSKSNYNENFAQVFTNWTITLAINDCSQSPVYCYLNKNLTKLKISPTLIFLPLTGSSSLSATNVTKNWAGNWQKIIGGTGDLKLDFSSLAGLKFRVPYIIYDKDNKYSTGILQLDDNGKGIASIKDFGIKYNSLIIMPSLQEKTSGFDTSDSIYPYSFTVSITGKDSQIDQTLIQKLLDQIESLKKQIADLMAQQQGDSTTQINTCSKINNNLSLGMTGSEVICLQTFLKNQGTGIYPSGYITGNFGSLTRNAVIKFQEKYASEILAPFGLSSGTGYVGSQTRIKINQMLNAK